MKENNPPSYLQNLRKVFQSRNYVVILLTNYTGSLFLAAYVYLNLFFRDVGISYLELGIANGWSMLIGLFFTMLGGYWADRYIHHRRYMATFNKFFIAIAMFLMPFVDTFISLVFVWTVFSLAQFCQASIDPILFESLPKKQMGTGTSLFTLTGIFGVLGLVLVGFLITDGFVKGLRIFFLLAGIASMVDFFIRLFFLEEIKIEDREETNNQNGLAQDLIKQYSTGLKVLLATIPLFFIVFLLDVASDINYQFAQNFFLNEEVGMNYNTLNYTMIGSTILGVIGGLAAGALLDRTTPFSIFLLFNSPMFPTWINFQSSELLLTLISSTAFIAVIIKAGNDVIWRTIAWGAVGRKLPREHTGKVMAILGMAIQALGVLISPLAGFIYEQEGGGWLLIIAMGINVIILTLLLISWLKSREDE
ncbi:MAG: MFS transporter [Candidatus Hodarchaeales archaeon]|jgi:MFS family permease